MLVGLTLAAVLGAGGFVTAISAATASDHRVGREVHRGAHDWGVLDRPSLPARPRQSVR